MPLSKTGGECRRLPGGVLIPGIQAFIPGMPEYSCSSGRFLPFHPQEMPADSIWFASTNCCIRVRADVMSPLSAADWIALTSYPCSSSVTRSPEIPLPPSGRSPISGAGSLNPAAVARYAICVRGRKCICIRIPELVHQGAYAGHIPARKSGLDGTHVVTLLVEHVQETIHPAAVTRRSVCRRLQPAAVPRHAICMLGGKRVCMFFPELVHQGTYRGIIPARERGLDGAHIISLSREPVQESGNPVSREVCTKCRRIPVSGRTCTDRAYHKDKETQHCRHSRNLCYTLHDISPVECLSGHDRRIVYFTLCVIKFPYGQSKMTIRTGSITYLVRSARRSVAGGELSGKNIPVSPAGE